MNGTSHLPAHSKLGASSMYRWEACPGSVRLSEGCAKLTSAAADEGTKVHELAARALMGEDPFDLAAGNAAYLDALVLYVDTVIGDYLDRQRLDNSKPDKKEHLFVEEKFHLKDLHPQLFGTSDAVMWDEGRRVLSVYDLKYGKTLVEVEDNTQLLYYALGAVYTHQMPVKDIQCVIVQPRAKTKTKRVQRWRFPAVELLDFEHRLLSAVKRTEDPFAPVVAGRYCFFCPAKNLCPAQLALAQKKAKEEFDDIEETSGGALVVDSVDLFA